jgi:hypothetical protein
VGAPTFGGLAFYNYRVTGDALKLPYSVHEKSYSVSPLFIWERLPSAPPCRHDVIREFHASSFLFVSQGMRRWRFRDPGVGQFVIFLVPALALALLAIFSYRSRQSLDDLAPYRQRAKLLTGLTQTKDRHLILVKYGLHHSYHNEWVFNDADIDRSKVLWARAMSAKADCKLAEYFKDRTIWLLEIDHDDAPIKLNPFQMEWCRSAR